MESQDFRALIGRSAELRAPVSPARQTSARIIADSRWLVTRTELILDVMAAPAGTAPPSPRSAGLAESRATGIAPGPASNASRALAAGAIVMFP